MVIVKAKWSLEDFLRGKNACFYHDKKRARKELNNKEDLESKPEL